MQPTGPAYVAALESRREMLVVFVGENDLYCVPLGETKAFVGDESDDGQLALQRAIAIGKGLAAHYAAHQAAPPRPRPRPRRRSIPAAAASPARRCRVVVFIGVVVGGVVFGFVNVAGLRGGRQDGDVAEGGRMCAKAVVSALGNSKQERRVGRRRTTEEEER